MGVFHVPGEVAGIEPPKRFIPVEKMLVDTGSEFTWIPAPILEQAGVTVAKKDQSFVITDGDTVARSMGYAFLRSSGFETVDEVVFAQPDDLTILGARTLEGFGVVPDPGRKKLAAAGPHLAARGGAET
jgi:predicted aspartyl protease